MLLGVPRILAMILGIISERYEFKKEHAVLCSSTTVPYLLREKPFGPILRDIFKREYTTVHQ